MVGLECPHGEGLRDLIEQTEAAGVHLLAYRVHRVVRVEDEGVVAEGNHAPQLLLHAVVTVMLHEVRRDLHEGGVGFGGQHNGYVADLLAIKRGLGHWNSLVHFPATGTDNSTVGKYVDTVRFKP